MRLIVTRPLGDAGPLREKLEAMGHDVVVAPLLDIVPVDGFVIPDRDYQAIAFTSANGARALAGHVAIAGLRRLPALAVGPQSADAARAAGFADVTVAGGDGKGLADHIVKTRTPSEGDILHPSGRETAGDFGAILAAAGFAVTRVVAYAAEPAAPPPGLIDGADGVLLYSPRSASLWRDAFPDAGSLVHFCLSHNVAAALPETVAKRIAASPEEEAMLALVAAEPWESRNRTGMSTIENESPGPVQPPVIDLDAEDVGTAETGTAASPSAADPVPEKPTPWRTILFACVAVLAAILGSLFYRYYGETIWPSAERVSLGERVAALEAADKTAAEQVRTLAATLDATKGEVARLPELDTRIAAVETALKALQESQGDAQPAPDPALVARIDALEKAMAELKAAPPPSPPPQTEPEPGKGPGLAAALSSLQGKFAAGAPYKDELAVITAEVPDAPGLGELARHADQGIANAQGLAAELEAAAATLDTGSPAIEEADDTVWGSLVSLLGSVVKVRTIGAADWKASALAAAELARRGDLRAAITSLSADAADMPPAIAAWRDKAAARLAAEAAFETVTAAVLQAIAAANRT